MTEREREREREFDQFYTNPLVSDRLVNTLFEILPSSIRKYFIEPSAGTGNFITSLVNKGVARTKIRGYDIDPKVETIRRTNYLELNLRFSKNRIIIGNPPFGHRGKLALEFLNKGLKEAPIVAMILPNIFNRYMIHSKIIDGAKLIHSESLPENSFILHDREYGVKCLFQVWVRGDFQTFSSNLRILTRPEIKHEDFETWIHNNTVDTTKYFNKRKFGWNIAVHRQGFYDYNKLITNSKDLIGNRQYFFIKWKTDEAKEIIKKIDFKKLARRNTQTPGFSTTDFVKEYKILKEKYVK